MDTIFQSDTSALQRSPLVKATGALLLLFLAFFFILSYPQSQWIFSLNIAKRRGNLPPGPSGVLILGSILEFQKANTSASAISAWLTSISRYGEMTTVHMGSRIWIILNSSRVMFEIISKHGKITTERPYLPVTSGLVSRFRRTVLRQTATWTEGRRVMHQLLNGSCLKTYGEWQELESAHLLAAYLYRPEKWYAHHFRYAASVINKIVFGHRLLKSTPELNTFLHAGLEFVHSMHVSLVDFFPWASRLPEILWRGKWKRMGEAHYNVYLSWWKPVKQALADGTAPPSFTRDVLLHKSTGYTGTDEDAMYLATSIVGGGSDNPRKTLNTFVMAALCHEDSFKRARQEIDALCGVEAERLPYMSDMEQLPFIHAMIKELIRWRPPVLMIPPHELTEDLNFEGYTFPKGTNFILNPIALCNECEQPAEFKPERWLDDQVLNITQGCHWQFGGGRRICVGYRVAQQGLFIALARLIYCFDYTPV